MRNLYRAEDLDFRLTPGTAVDWGAELLSITDGFTVRAPNLEESRVSVRRNAGRPLRRMAK